jgi:hypothetical protein
MEELTEEEHRAYLIAEESLEDAVLERLQEGSWWLRQEGRRVRYAFLQAG